MEKITMQQKNEMVAAQDSAAEGFWAYPDSEWQWEFQSQWLWENLRIRKAVSPDGLVWGEE